MAHTDAITTAGHNISNANTEGYSRQRVQLKEFDPLYRPDLERPERPGMIGQELTYRAWNVFVTKCLITVLQKASIQNHTGRPEAIITQ